MNAVGANEGARIDEAPRRQTPAERLHEVTMAAMQRTPSPPEHSVTMSRNAKGVMQFEVTVRGYELGTVLTECRWAIDQLNGEHPYAEPNA